MIKFNPHLFFNPVSKKISTPPPRLSTPPPKEKFRPPTSFWTIRTLDTFPIEIFISVYSFVCLFPSVYLCLYLYCLCPLSPLSRSVCVSCCVSEYRIGCI